MIDTLYEKMVLTGVRFLHAVISPALFFLELIHIMIDVGKEHYEYFEPRIGNLVAEKYNGFRRVSPELMEFGDEGGKPVRSWTGRGDHIVSFDEE